MNVPVQYAKCAFCEHRLYKNKVLHCSLTQEQKEEKDFCDSFEVDKTKVKNSSQSITIQNCCRFCLNKRTKGDSPICNLTNQVVEYESYCDNFQKDEYSVRQYETHMMDIEKTRISGWLAIFLWLGLGLGMVMSIVGILTSLTNIVVFDVLSILSLIIILITGGSAIHAFYKEKANAVALALTYLVMIFVDHVFFLVFYYVLDIPITNGYSLFRVVCGLIWVAIWGCYLLLSIDVKNLFPVEKRKWLWLEKGLLLIWLLLYVSMFFCLSNLKKEADDAVRKAEQEAIEARKNKIPQYIKEYNVFLPDTTDGVVQQKIQLKEKIIVYTYKLLNVNGNNYDDEYLKAYGLVQKMKLLKQYSLEKDKYQEILLEDKYAFQMNYIDVNDQILYTINISSEEYSAAKKMRKYIDRNDDIINQILTYTQQLSRTIMGDCNLKKISLSKEKDFFIYSVYLPNVVNARISVITKDYLCSYLKDNWQYMKDYIYEAAEMYQMGLQYDFYTSKGKLHQSIKIPYSEYSKY